jgi:hypothetical protein
MIFLSHQHKDKPIVGPVANNLAEVFGRANIFFDDWSIQPGDGIIDKMNQGLEECKYFFFFITSNSLNSDMVKQEWQNIIMRESKYNVTFIPIRLENVEVPAMLAQRLYLDMYRNGIDVVTRQMVELIEKGNVQAPQYEPYQNIQAIMSNSDGGNVECCIEAKTFYEPICSFAVATKFDQSQIDVAYNVSGMMRKNYIPNHSFNGESFNVFTLRKEGGITPGFPTIINIIAKEGTTLNIREMAVPFILLKEHSQGEYRQIPLKIK